MRFTCEKCNAKYNIADEKIRGKIIKVRCKRCNNLLVIRDESHAKGHDVSRAGTKRDLRKKKSPSVPPQQADASRHDSEPEPVWYCGLDGDEKGPLTLFDVEVGIRDGSITADHFVWRDGMDDWVPIEQVDELKDFLSLPEPSVEAVQRRKKAQERREKDRLQDKERKDKERKDKERKDKERKDKERKDKERRDKERRDKERRDKERKDKERKDKERKDKERKDKERKDKERKDKERKDKERKDKERKDKERKREAQDRVIGHISKEDDDSGHDKPAVLPGPPVVDFDDDLLIDEVAEDLLQESLDDEYELLQSDPMAVVAKREKLGEISRVIALQAGVASHKRRLGVGILVVGTFVLTIGLLVVLAFSQGWFTNKIDIGKHSPSHADSAKNKSAVASLDDRSAQDAKRIRDSIWVVEPKNQNRLPGAKAPGTTSHVHSQGKSKKERDLLAFYENQDQEKNEIMPRVPRGTTSVAIEMLKLPSTSTKLSPGFNGAADSKVEVVPQGPGSIAGHGRLTDVQIRMVIRRHARQVKKCFERQLKRDPSIKGKLLVTARVKPNGRIKKVKVDPEKFHGTYLEECLKKEIRHWRFPSFNGEAYDLTFPYAMSARESY